MKHEDYNQELLVRYLLGHLDEPEQERVERAYLADADWQERLAIAEDELIDDYIHGTLPAADRAAFETHFLNSPRRHERVMFARAWQQYVSKASPARPAETRPETTRRPSRTAVWLLLAATVVLAAGGGWLAVESARLRRELAQSQAERAALAQSEAESRRQVDDERARSEALAQQLNEVQPQGPGEANRNGSTLPTPAIASFMLAAGMTRGAGEAQSLSVPRGATQVRLQLLFRPPDSSPDSTYRAVLRTTEGRVVLSRDGLKAQARGAAHIVNLSTATLASGAYILTLDKHAAGSYETVAEYAFTVARK
ncbi:MAG TPA: hypothetical protein VJZ91_09865 [Blastocatellia bacterium]|nr:hypothetical protein [Blastocatellia bacterium]